jgi:hypothetical protein
MYCSVMWQAAGGSSSITRGWACARSVVTSVGAGRCSSAGVKNGGFQISPLADEDVDDLAVLVDRPIEIRPPSGDFDGWVGGAARCLWCRSFSGVASRRTRRAGCLRNGFSSDLCREVCGGLAGVDVVVAVGADHEGFMALSCHEGGPLNHPGFGRDSLLGSGDQADQVAQLVQGLELDRWPTSAGSVQSTVVIPIHPCRSGDVDFSNSMPRPARFNQLGLVQAYQ